MWNFHTVEYYSAVKNDIMKFAWKWIELKKNIVSEVTQKDENGMCSLIN